MIQFIAWPGSLFFGRMAERSAPNGRSCQSCSFTASPGMPSSSATSRTSGCSALSSPSFSAVARRSAAPFSASLSRRGEAAKFFGFFTVSAKFASLFGPLLFALVTDVTDSTRLSILALSAFFVIGMVLLAGVNLERGKSRSRLESP